MNRHIPLLFSFSDRVIGMGFTADVISYGRVLAVEENNEVWIYGVEPGALAANGSDPKEALESFRLSFTNVLRDTAAESHTFEAFSRTVEAFFADVNDANATEWALAVEAVRSGTIDVANVRREPAESRRFVQVREVVFSTTGQRDYEVTGSEISSAVAA